MIAMSSKIDLPQMDLTWGLGLSMIFSFLDQDKAVIQDEFQYKNCCKDEQGSIGNFFFLFFHSFAKGYPD